MSRTFGHRRNGDSYEHPEGAPDPWDADRLKWPPDEPEPEVVPGHDVGGKTFQEALSDMIDPIMRDTKRVRARVRACLLAEGLPEVYADCVADEVAEGWANGDPAPIWTMPGYEPPRDPEGAKAWEDLWEEERRRRAGGDSPRGNPRRGRWKLDSIKPSRVDGKKYTATFFDESDGRRKTVHFGASGYSDFTMHKDPERKRRYLERHGRGREDWDDPTTPGALSRWLLWNKPTFKESLRDFKRRFGF